MTISELISILAIISTLTIAVVSQLITLGINKSNLEAKRSELAYEKRLEAFRSIVEALGKVRYANSQYNTDKSAVTRNALDQAMQQFLQIYRKELIFLPPNIEKWLAK